MYYNELMTSSALQIGMRFSALSLSLLKDTNYYSNVDLSISETIYWGHKKGCLFARSLSSSHPNTATLLQVLELLVISTVTVSVSVHQVTIHMLMEAHFMLHTLMVYVAMYPLT